MRDSRGHGRETIESLVIAFTLALLFRAFEAEAFVIPTGSMAPTLMGRHKDLVCASCGAAFRVGSSREIDEMTGGVNEAGAPRRGDCPNCGRVMNLDRREASWHDARLDSFSGDRIIVDKLAYDFRQPARWDVVVFKYPEDAKTNYIKRLIGLPGETITIAGGDIWVSCDGGTPEIARKPSDTLVAMLQCVHDSRHVAADLARAGWPTAWCDWSAPGAEAAARWTTDDDGRSFAVACTPGATAELRFRRLVPTDDDWKAVDRGGSVAGRARPVLVGDFQPYNNGSRLRPMPGNGTTIDGNHWVGDLAVELDLESRDAAGRVTLDLVEADAGHTCTIDIATGAATLARITPDGTVEATASTAVHGRGRWRLVFANVDDELSLFVDGRPVRFDAPTTWARSSAAVVRPVVAGGEPGDARRGDLSPAGITAIGADVRVTDLRVFRDVYYIASGDGAVMAGSRDEPACVTYPLAADQFFMLGDNSGSSKDSRAWGTRERPLHHVDRHLLVGRALAVFWPHGRPTAWSVPVRIFGWELRLPFLPNFARMRYVR